MYEVRKSVDMVGTMSEILVNGNATAVLEHRCQQFRVSSDRYFIFAESSDDHKACNVDPVSVITPLMLALYYLIE